MGIFAHSSRKTTDEVSHCKRDPTVQQQSLFQFIPKVFCVVKVRALCKPAKFFLTKDIQPCLSKFGSTELSKIVN